MLNKSPFVLPNLLLSTTVVLAASAALAREPTEDEQYMLELINRARLNPEAEVQRLGTGSLNEGPPTLGGQRWVIEPGPRQPLAFNPALIDAASAYADQMNAADQFCHTCLGSSADSRMQAAGYTPGPYTGAFGTTRDYGGSGYVPGRENLSWYAEGPANGYFNHPQLQGRGLVGVIDRSHVGLFNDFTVPSRGHRSTMLYGEWREVGLGISVGRDNGNTYDSFYAVQNYAYRPGNHFLTGIAYRDLDKNGFFTPATGEALGDLTVEARNSATQALAGSTTTYGSGGYSLALPAGTYDVTFRGNGLDHTVRSVQFGNTKNIKLDYVPSQNGAALAVSQVSVNHHWKQVSLAGVQGQPVVIAGPATYNGGQAGVVRLRNVTAANGQVRLEARFQEWEYLDGGHAVEQVPLLALPEGRHQMPDGSVWEVGSFQLDGHRKFRSIPFKAAFAGVPRLFLTVQSNNDGQAVAVRARQVGSAGFQAALTEQELNTDGHGSEKVGYLAIHQPAGRGQVSATNGTVGYELGQGSVNSGFKVVNTATATTNLRAQEDQSRDSETAHAWETIDLLRLNGLWFAQDVSYSGGDPIALRRRD